MDPEKFVVRCMLAFGLDFEAIEYLSSRHPEISIWKRTASGISGWSHEQISGWDGLKWKSP